MSAQNASSSGLGLIDLVKHRLRKQGFYDSPEYWDLKSDSYEGLSRSMWPSQVYNVYSHARQMEIIDRLWPDLDGKDVIDVGCGTGRASRHMSQRGGRVTGLDFSPRTVEVARGEAAAAGLEIDFSTYNVNTPTAPELRGRFDRVLVIGCLTVACSNMEMFEAALQNIASFTRGPGAQILFMEPIHRSRLLRRILSMSVDRWTESCEALGLRPLDRVGMNFVPVRYLCAFRDLPHPLVAPLYRAGERVLDLAPKVMDPFADYKCLLFEVTDRA